MDSALFVSVSKAGREVGRGGGRGGTSKGKLDSRCRSEGLASQAKIACNRCQKPGHIRPNCPERQCFKCQGWGHEAVSCPSKVPTPKQNVEKEKEESAVMVVSQEPDSEVTAETKLDETDGGDKTCFMSVEIEKDISPVGKLPPETTVERWVSDSGCSHFYDAFTTWSITARVEASIELLTTVRCRLKALEIYR